MIINARKARKTLAMLGFFKHLLLSSFSPCHLALAFMPIHSSLLSHPQPIISDTDILQSNDAKQVRIISLGLSPSLLPYNFSVVRINSDFPLLMIYPKSVDCLF